MGILANSVKIGVLLSAAGPVAAQSAREQPRVVTKAGVFDLDDFGPEIAQDHRAPRPGQDARQVEDPDAVKGGGNGDGWRRLLIHVD